MRSGSIIVPSGACRSPTSLAQEPTMTSFSCPARACVGTHCLIENVTGEAPAVTPQQAPTLLSGPVNRVLSASALPTGPPAECASTTEGLSGHPVITIAAP